MPNLTIVYKGPSELSPRARNPRTHSKKQIDQIAESIRKFGFLNPVLVDADGGIVAGHGRVAAAKLIGMRDVPTVCVDHLTPAQIRAYVIADNKLAENAGWDRELLALELKDLSVDLDFDIQVTGFETPEIDLLIGELEGGAADDVPDPADEVPTIDRSQPAVTRLGDLWVLGPHRLLCGDATKRESYRCLLGGESAQMVFTDPPYNVPIAGHVSGLGKVQHREFAMASGEMSAAEFTGFLQIVFQNMRDTSANGSLHFICMDWRHMRELLDAAEVYSELKNLCIWSKTNAGMGSLYRSQHELVFVFKNGTAPHINNVELGRHGRYRTNVWAYAGANSFGKDRDADLALHPTVKPIKLVLDAVLDCSDRGKIVLDPFAGSGTTLIAAERAGRRGYGIEIDPLYVDTVIRRVEESCDLKAIHAETGETFAEVRAGREKVPEMQP